MSYTPKPDSYAAKVLAHLMTRPDGTWITSAEVAGMLGIPIKMVPSLLDYARAAGVLRKKVTPCLQYALCTDSTREDPASESRRSRAAARPIHHSQRADAAMCDVDDWPITHRLLPAAGQPLPYTLAARSVFELGSQL